MKIFKKVLKAIIFIPITLIALVITFEIIGMIINHAATVRQTRTLQNTIQKAYRLQHKFGGEGSPKDPRGLELR